MATCRKCGGAGWVWGEELDYPPRHDPTWGIDDTRYTCDRCDGAGTVPDDTAENV